MKTIIDIKNLNKEFTNKVIYKNANLKINEGEKLAIIGKNGIGKTVLSRIIVGLENYSSGEIDYIGLDKYEDIGLQFQSFNINNNFKPKDILNFYVKYYKDRWTNDEIKKLYNIFKIEDFINVKYGSLSGGQKQRINLITTILKKPKVLILDEFVTGLDLLIVEDIVNFINDYIKKHNATIVVISHNPEEIRKLCDNLVIIKNYEISKKKSVKTIENKYKGKIGDFILEVIK